MHIVFVYGTLKVGYGNHYLIGENPLSVARGEAVSDDANFAMTNIGFPYLITVQTGGFLAKGELYQVDDSCLARLDRLEGVPHHYRREQRWFKQEAMNGHGVRLILAWVYICNRDNPPGYEIEPDANGHLEWTPGAGRRPSADDDWLTEDENENEDDGYDGEYEEA